MKKLLVILLAFVMVLGLAACGGEEPAEEPEAGSEIAMITDLGSIDDKSFNQGTWEGIVAYAEENGITHKYYKPTEQSTDAYLAAIQLAVEGGAKVIVTPGFLFEEPIFLAQDLYPEVTFILIDGNPHNTDYSVYHTASNTVGIVFAEEEVGYLAGYAAVKDGYTKLGYMGGMAVPAVIRYGYGFVQGAEAAAAEMGITSLDLKYFYTGNFDATPENQTQAASWYAEGVEVIFAAGGLVGNSVMSAAEAAGKAVIGVDVDQSAESDTVIVSAMKGLATSVWDNLDAYYNGTFPGGEGLVYGASNDGVSLSMDSAKFTTFSQADYDALFAKLADGSVSIKNDTDAALPTDLGLSIVKITLVE
jgi:basic membrane protein A